MSKNRILSLEIKNLLSFGEDSPRVELGPLNVLVGPNGSGKSNLFEVLSLLRSTSKDFAGEIGDGGGIQELLWKGGLKNRTVVAPIDVRTEPCGVKNPLRYLLSFTRTKAQVKIVDERIENDLPDKGHNQPYLYFSFK